MIYFFALAVIQEEKSGSYLHNCACDVVGLMKIRAKKGNGDIVPGKSPTLVAQLLVSMGLQTLFTAIILRSRVDQIQSSEAIAKVTYRIYVWRDVT